MTARRPDPLIVAAARLPPIAFVPAKFRRQHRRAAPCWIVLHCTDGAEGFRKAEDCAVMLRDCPPENARSIHWVVDTNSIVQCVLPVHEAWHAGKTGNTFGEGIELCGRASQTRAQWLDAASLPMLGLAARLTRWRCSELGIPVQLVTAADALRAHSSGITTHAALASAFGETKHWDPGPGFPLQEFVEAVAAAGGGVT